MVRKNTNMHVLKKTLILFAILLAGNHSFANSLTRYAKIEHERNYSLKLLPCVAGTASPTLVDRPNFLAQSNTYTIPCGVANADLSTLSSSNQPAGTVLSIHSASTPTEANKVTPHNSIPVGTYHVSFFDPKENCYSTANQQITVVAESNCSTSTCHTALLVNNSSPNLASNAVTKCSSKYNKHGKILYFPWSGNLVNGQTASVTAVGVTYTATVSNYVGASNAIISEDLDSHIWRGAKLKYLYSDGNSGINEGWYMGSHANSSYSWIVTVTATHNASGLQFPVNILAYDLESTSTNESATIQTIDGEKWSLFEEYKGSCNDSNNDGLGNTGIGQLTGGSGSSRIVYNETEHTGGNSIWVSYNASQVFLAMHSSGGKQGVGIALLLDPDTDGDGIPDKYESVISGFVRDDSGAALPNTTVKLFDENDVELQSTVTDASGNYSFTNLKADVFKVQEIDPAGYYSQNTNTLNSIRTELGKETCNVNFVDRVILTPVELVHFSVKEMNQNTYLSWETSSETNNDKFIVEYSHNGVDFKPLTEVNGGKYTTTIQRYSIVHQNVYTLGLSKIYYRLKQVDFSGEENYIGKVEEVELSKRRKETIVYPVPASQGEPIQVIGNDIKGYYYVFDVLGQLVLSGQATENQFEIETSNLVKGAYVVQFSNQESANFIIK